MANADDLPGFDSVRLTADAYLGAGPIDLYWVVLVSNVIGGTQVEFRNGRDANADSELSISTATATTRPVILTPAKRFSRGLFVDTGGNLDAVTVAFRKVRRGGSQEV